MVLGYNQPRPTPDDYSLFLKTFVQGLEKKSFAEISLMVYGSYVRADHVPGRSDIDALLTFPDDVVLDKEKYHEIALLLSESLQKHPIPFQVTPTDLATMRDGRFNSYNPSFQDYFYEEGQILSGPDYRSQFTFTMPEHPDQSSFTFNLRKARQGLLFAEYDKKNDYLLFLNRFNKTLDGISRGSKQILFFTDNTLRKNRFSALAELPLYYPLVDLTPLHEIHTLYQHHPKLDALYKQPQAVLELWDASLTCFEQLLKAYISR